MIVAELHRPLLAPPVPSPLFSATNAKNWPLMRVTAITRHRQARRRRPDDARPDELIRAELAAAFDQLRLDQHRLRRGRRRTARRT